MKEDAQNKASRRRRLRDSFPAPLNQIALRHVDAVQALDENQRGVLARALAQAGVARLADCLAVIKSSSEQALSETDLSGLLNLPPAAPHPSPGGGDRAAEKSDVDYLAGLLMKCYRDMPELSADALAASEVMAPSLQVVSTTRRALEEARSDFVITVLYTLFEERWNEIERKIAGNPSFIKALQLSRPQWEPKQLTVRNKNQ
jgi:hypothetical protein